MSIPRHDNWVAVEQAVGQGQLDQAVRLLTAEPVLDAAGRRLAIDLHDQLVDRFRVSIDREQWLQALNHLVLLRELEGVSPQYIRMLGDLQIASGRWAEACMRAENLEEIEALHQWSDNASIPLPAIKQLHLQVYSIQGAKKLAALGRFAEAEQALTENRQDSEWIQNWKGKFERDHEACKTLLAELHHASESQDWEATLKVAEQILTIAGRHPMALSMKQRAMAELAAKGGNPRKLMEPKPIMAIAPHHPSTRGGSDSPIDSPSSKIAMPILWIDGVGGYLLCDSIESVIGQAVPGNIVDLMIVGDLSRRAAAIRRSGEDHLLQPLQNIAVNQQKIDRATILRDGDVIGMGPRIEVRYSRPNKLSATAKLEMISRHRWQPSVDGVLLMGDSCVLGPGSTSHVLCPYWSSDVVLFRHRGQWMCKSSQVLEMDGKEYRDAVPLTSGKRIRGNDFSLALE